MPTTKPRYNLTLSKELLERIQDYRFENRFPSQSSAIISLIEKGLMSVEQEQETQHD